MKKTIAVAAVTAAVLGTVSGAAEATRPKPASVTGSAEIRMPFIAPDNDIRSFTFDVHSVPYSRPAPGLPLPGLPTDARGTVRVSHHVPEINLTVVMEAEVDCLVTSPQGAAFTAVVTKASEQAKDRIGRRLGFSVYDGGRHGDRVGFSWSTVNLDRNRAGEYEEVTRVGTCMAPAPHSLVTKGGYTVQHADLLPPPK